MALQDDIFDVRDALKDTRAFDRIIEHLNSVEQVAENSTKVLGALAAGLRAVRWIEKNYQPD
ncbi:MAG: hypothetical protein E5V72_01400 [Mesorhizobium sp.]|uniref:hypothetical protein n=1 Tax=Mesorhizobium sp. TaxID=1871066 RepID=UPI000FE3DCA9|nr:hypothetical protein [Mesorhizobium sp.]RWH50279.1 MAG: hypothetical protein EOQ80_04725 [Mesorhizobium sp.]RWH52254.1 MAG: hypothetical protein EOQ82_26515 [Mesorhizobium sp.]RWI69713.1 MAG: hypothetical protein EOR18_21020 [Mesorhizobium sp.]RWI76180.1 MAG: hypothetical protein EOR19_18610 [Mesorhizobium sp.]RWJ09663.1 MAG: hypothetical protein EOR24_18430 [Mesorhizobium sp.]